MLSFFKSITYFTKAERRGTIVLLIFIGTVFCIGYILPDLRKKEDNSHKRPEQRKAEKECEAFLSSLKEDTYPRRSYHQRKRQAEHPPVVLAPFNPNTADFTTFRRLGLPEWMVKNILKYRVKGGLFRKVSDFKKIYGLTAGQYNRLLPYIILQRDTLHKASQLYKPKQEQAKVFKYSPGTTINLNLADTTELKKVPGIGSEIARLIINYRQRLGGFYQIEQLEEIHLDSQLLRSWFIVHPENIQRININRAGIARLNAHPYINFYQAKAIIEYRRKKGALTNLKPFTLYDEFTEKDLERIRWYVCFE